MNFQETLEYMYELLPMYQRVGKTAFKKDLTNTIKLLGHLGNPQLNFRSIHIAGTNGKGSSAHMLASVLQSAGYKTGLYTSPHLKQFTERIKINGTEVEESFVCDFIEKLKEIIEEVEPSFFEITVAMAFSYFAEKKVDIAIVEVGMGGRFDSTNVLLPVISLITSISYDHMEFLGSSMSEIAFEKAGIIKPGIPVVISETQEEITSVFNHKATETKSSVFYADRQYKVKTEYASASSFNFLIESEGQTKQLLTDLGGIYQVKNIPGVLRVLDLLNQMDFYISEDQIRSGFQNIAKNTGFKGRWQKLSDDPLIICDTAHNEAGVKLIVEQLKQLDCQQLHIIWGAVEGKDHENIFHLLPKEAFYYFCQANLPRALKAEKLLEMSSEVGLIGEIIKDVNEAIATAKLKAEINDLIFVGGSNFVVAEIKEL